MYQHNFSEQKKCKPEHCNFLFASNTLKGIPKFCGTVYIKKSHDTFLNNAQRAVLFILRNTGKKSEICNLGHGKVWFTITTLKFAMTTPNTNTCQMKITSTLYTFHHRIPMWMQTLVIQHSSTILLPCL